MWGGEEKDLPVKKNAIGRRDRAEINLFAISAFAKSGAVKLACLMWSLKHDRSSDDRSVGKFHWHLHTCGTSGQDKHVGFIAIKARGH